MCMLVNAFRKLALNQGKKPDKGVCGADRESHDETQNRFLKVSLEEVTSWWLWLNTERIVVYNIVRSVTR